MKARALVRWRLDPIEAERFHSARTLNEWERERLFESDELANEYHFALRELEDELALVRVQFLNQQIARHLRVSQEKENAGLIALKEIESSLLKIDAQLTERKALVPELVVDQTSANANADASASASSADASVGKKH